MPARKADWAAWHREYDDPSSRLSRRLRVIQEQLRTAIDTKPGPLNLISMCAGRGRDVIDALAGHERGGDATGRLVEIDRSLAEEARAGLREAGLEGIEVACADAGVSDSYAGAVPADILLVCGVFGNIADEDVQRTVDFLPCLSAPGAVVIWTRGRPPDRDVPQVIRGWFSDSGYEELAFVAPADETFSVGVHRLVSEPRPFEPDVRLFSFLW
jgi:hypothetical protein